MDIENHNFWEFIQIDFIKFEAKHFHLLDNATLKVLRDYYFPHKFWIELNLNFNKTCNIAMLEAVIAK